MNRQILVAAILSLFSLAFSQAGFAEESSLMTNRIDRKSVV